MPILRSILICLSYVLLVLPVAALDVPRSSVVLAVSGEIAVTNDDDRAIFDRAMLKALDWQEIETYTPYTEGPQKFAGPTLSSLLDALGVEDGTLLATALNDYAITIPVSDARSHNVLLALDQNGRPMRRRDKGPIWIIYPWDNPEGFGNLRRSRMIWQLNRLQVNR